MWWLWSTVALSGWTLVQTEHFEVVGDTAQAAGEAARRLEDFEGLLARLYPGLHSAPTARLPILAFSDVRAFRPLLPGDGRQDADCLYLTFGALQMILIKTSVSADQLARWAVAEVALPRLRPPFPFWLREGMAQYYSTAEINGKTAHLGVAPPGTIALLRERRWIPLERLVAAGPGSAELEGDGRELYRAEAWALVHWALTDPTQARSAQLAAFVGALDGGASAEEACASAFGLPLAELTAALEHYAAALGVPTLDLPYASSPTRVDPRPVSEADVLARQGWALALERRPTEAAEVLRQAAAADAASWEAHAGLGLLANQQDDPATAHREFAEAVRLGGDEAWVHLGYATTVARTATGDELTTALASADRVVALRPDLVAGHLAAIDLALRRNDAAGADARLKEGLKADAHDERLRLQVALAHLRHGNTEVARAALERLQRAEDRSVRELAAARLAGLPPAP